MRRILMVTVFMLAMLAWAAAQQPGSTPDRPGGQAPSPSTQVPDASQPQPGVPSAGQAQPDSPAGASEAANAPITEGCLGGSNPNFTLTDKAGTTYKLNIPANADASPLNSHVGESVQVMGQVKDAGKADKASIDVSKIGKGTSNCPASSGAQKKQ